MCNRGGLSVIHKRTVTNKVKKYFSKSGISKDVTCQNVTSKRGKRFSSSPEPSDRERRQSTAESTASVADKKPRSRKGCSFANLPSKAKKAFDMCEVLFEIGVADDEQPKESLEFLIDQVLQVASGNRRANFRNRQLTAG